nr:LamG domain-containing protein [Polyangiaceae bacterium]
HWALDDNPDPTVVDVSGSSPGVNMHGSISVSGRVGTALKFADKTDHVRIPNSVALNPTPALTVDVWVQPTGVLSGADTTQSPFFDKQQSSAGYGLFSGASQGLRAVIGNVTAKQTGTTFAAASWHHIVGSWDGANVRLYLDGALANTAAKTTALSPYSGEARVGGDGSPISGSFLGAVDELVVYDIALSDAQVTELFNLGTAGTALPK